MQYIDKYGNRHNIPLHSIQPKLSPDKDNMLYESHNGLKVDKTGKVFGYLNSYDGKFYYDRGHSHEIEPNKEDTYVDITVESIWKPYVWDDDKSVYRGIGSGQGQGSATLVSMLQDQYDILPDSEKQDGSFAYFVEDTNEGAEAIIAEMLAEEINKTRFKEISTLSTIDVEGYYVPSLTSTQIKEAYDAVKNDNKEVYIIDPLNTIKLKVNDVSSIHSPEVSITVLFEDKLVLSYETGTPPTITGKIIVDKKELFDSIYPIGSYAYGIKPTIGTWTKVGESKILNNSDDQYIVIESGKYTIGEISPSSSKYYTITPTKTGYDCIGIIPSFGGGTYYSHCAPMINFGGSNTARTCTVSYWNNSTTLTAQGMYVGWQAIFRSKYGTEVVTKWKRTA